MANDEHVALLRRGTAVWNKWRERNSNAKPDLSGTDLSRADLSEANLSGANLNWAYFRRADLSDANVSRADLSEAKLIGVDFSHANLSRADLSQANLIQADLGRADLSEAKLIGADLSHANVTRADLSRAHLNGAYLRGGNLSEANLFEANLSQATLSETIFGAVDLTGTNGLSECRHYGPSVVDFRTLFLSQNLSITFLRGCGLHDNLIDYLPSLRGDAIQFYSCFISYSTRDQFFADRLHADLQNNGVRCWFAPHDIRIGDRIWDAIDEAIRVRDKLLIILSEASIASDWVEDEVSSAYDEERERKVTLLSPIRIDEALTNTTEPWARKLRDRHIGDFRQWKDPAEYQKSLKRLLRDLKPGGAK